MLNFALFAPVMFIACTWKLNKMMSVFDVKQFDSRIDNKVIVSAEFDEDCAVNVNIGQTELYERICNFALNYGKDLQGVFETRCYSYLTCFIYDLNAFTKHFCGDNDLSLLFNHGYGENERFLISVPISRKKKDIGFDEF